MSKSRERGKKLITAAGTSSRCFVTHNGVRRPSGKVGEPGDRGEMGECSARETLDPDELVLGSMGLDGGEVRGGSAFLGGSLIV